MNAAESSSTTTDNDGFIFVSHKKGKKRSSGKKANLKCVTSIQDSFENLKEIDPEKVTSLQYDLEKSEFFNGFKESLDSILHEKISKDSLSEHLNTLSIHETEKESTDIICYGLGKFSTSKTARHQLAFLLALKMYLKTKTVSVYDPVFSSNEKDCLIKLGLNVLSVNEKAKRPISQKTIFFMPHCDLPLYNNLLWSNWSENQIVKIIVIGNSFSTYSKPKIMLKSIGHYIKLANEFVTEKKVSNNYVYKNAFNDMSIHHFKDESLSKVPAETWLDVKEPVYLLEDAINYS